MIIEEVSILGVNNLKDFRFSPDRINVFIGKNGQGKSTVLEAVRYALTGKALPEQNEGSQVTIRIRDFGEIRRVYKSNRNEVFINGKSTSQKSINDALLKKFAIKQEVSNFMTSSKLMGAMNGSDLSAFFLGNNMIQIKVAIEKLHEICGFVETEKKLLEEKLSAPEVSLGDIDMVWGIFKKQRTALRDKIRVAEVESKYTGETISEEGENLQSELIKISTELVNGKSELSTFEQIQKKREQLMGEIKKAEAELVNLVEKPNAVNRQKVSENLEMLHEFRDNINITLSEISSQCKQLKEILENLEKANCPISERLVCKTDKTQIRAEITEVLEKQRSSHTRQSEQLSVINQKIEKLKKWVLQYDKLAEQYQKQENIKGRISALNSSLPELPKQPDADALDKLQKRYNSLNAAMGNQKKYQEAKVAAEQLKELTKELTSVENIVKQLEPKGGIRKEILERSVAKLQQYIQSRLNILLPGYNVKVNCEKGFRILLEKDGRELSAEHMSSGEKSRVWLALMDLVNALSGYGVLLYDSTDALDAEAVKNLFDLFTMEQVTNLYQHVFVTAIDYKEVTDMLSGYDFKVFDMNSAAEEIPAAA